MQDTAKGFFLDGCGRCKRFQTADCSARRWSEGLAALRAICLGAELGETIKWGHPCYEHADRNIALLGAFQDDFRITFLNAGLLKEAGAALQRPGPNSQQKSIIRFSSEKEVGEKAALIQACLATLKKAAEDGVKPPKIKRDLVLPEELSEALESDPDLAEAFEALTPGRQISYVIHLNGAKKPETRYARIEKCRERILAGKGLNDR